MWCYKKCKGKTLCSHQKSNSRQRIWSVWQFLSYLIRLLVPWTSISLCCCKKKRYTSTRSCRKPVWLPLLQVSSELLDKNWLNDINWDIFLLLLPYIVQEMASLFLQATSLAKQKLRQNRTQCSKGILKPLLLFILSFWRSRRLTWIQLKFRIILACNESQWMRIVSSCII